MKSFSIKYKILALVIPIVVIFGLILALNSPKQANDLARETLNDNAKFITKLLIDNLSVGLQTVIFDDGAELEKSLNQLKTGAEHEDISKVLVFDPDLQLIKGLNADENETTRRQPVEEVVFEETKEILIAWSPIKDSDKNIMGFVEINFNKYNLNSSSAKLQRFSIIFSFFMMIGITIVSYFVAMIVIVKPIIKTRDMLKDIASGEGDLTQRLNISSKDEVGEVADWFNIFIEKIQTIMKEITENTETLSSSGTELNTISGEMTKGININVEKSNTVSAAAEEMNSNMETVTIAMNSTTEKLNVVSTGTKEMTSSINEIAQNASKSTDITKNAVTQAERASVQVAELGRAAQEIVKVTDTIADISNQTNLLALNATIEAARAGDAGKGFAVVANEIKELAKQTAEATDEIAKQLHGVQDTSKNTATEIKSITDIINEIDNIVGAIAAAVEEQNATTSENARGISEISDAIIEVNENIHQSSTATSQIAEDIADVNSSTNEMSNSASQVQHSSVELSEMVGKLKEIVGQFKI